MKAETLSLSKMVELKNMKIERLKEERAINSKEIQFLRTQNKELTENKLSLQEYIDQTENAYIEQGNQEQNKIQVGSLTDSTELFLNKIEIVNENSKSKANKEKEEGLWSPHVHQREDSMGFKENQPIFDDLEVIEECSNNEASKKKKAIFCR